MLTPESLLVGADYFSIELLNVEKEVFKVQTYIYIGKNLYKSQKEKDEYYFQDAQSYFEYGSFLNLKDKRRRKSKQNVIVLDNESLSFLFDIEELKSYVDNIYHKRFKGRL